MELGMGFPNILQLGAANSGGGRCSIYNIQYSTIRTNSHHDSAKTI